MDRQRVRVFPRTFRYPLLYRIYQSGYAMFTFFTNSKKVGKPLRKILDWGSRGRRGVVFYKGFFWLPRVNESCFCEYGNRFELHLLGQLVDVAGQDVGSGAAQFAGHQHHALLVARSHLHLKFIFLFC